MKGKPRILSVKEHQLEERAPPGHKEFRFVHTHEPKPARRKPKPA